MSSNSDTQTSWWQLRGFENWLDLCQVARNFQPLSERTNGKPENVLWQNFRACQRPSVILPWTHWTSIMLFQDWGDFKSLHSFSHVSRERLFRNVAYQCFTKHWYDSNAWSGARFRVWETCWMPQQMWQRRGGVVQPRHPTACTFFLCMSLGAVLIKAAGWARFSQLKSAKGKKKERVLYLMLI